MAPVGSIAIGVLGLVLALAPAAANAGTSGNGAGAGSAPAAAATAGTTAGTSPTTTGIAAMLGRVLNPTVAANFKLVLSDPAQCPAKAAACGSVGGGVAQ